VRTPPHAPAGSAVSTAVPRQITGRLTAADRWDHVLARWGVDRAGHRVEPGLYALGDPGRDGPVFVTANYTLSFDALRSAVSKLDCFILVLDTQGINVWCAAGKGTFGTEELVRRIGLTGLADVVDGRTVIVPQLGATGVSAGEVKKESGFFVEYGPVRAADIPEYLGAHEATPRMRRVRFGLVDRLLLVPVEFVHVIVPMLAAAAALYFAGGWLAAWAAVAAFSAGTVLFPILLPWIPTPDFTTKGLTLGALVAGPFAAARVAGSSGTPWWWEWGWGAVCVTGMAPVTAFLALLFTGSTTFTSKSGVAREIRRYTRLLAFTLGAGAALAVALTIAGARGAVR
jgi:hypothetical protein